MEDPIPITSPEFTAGDDAAPRVTPRTSPWVPVLGVLVVLLLAGFVFLEPAVKSLGPQPRRRLLVEDDLALVAQQRSLEAFTAAWFFMLGASLGSFLHCVEYRVPRRISIVARGSACPGCATPIRMWHNVPVLGWLWLRGRCAACGWAIPSRYAFTEFAFGLVFVLLMTAELAGAGINLPFWSSNPSLGMVENVWTLKWNLLGVYIYHSALITLLLTYCLFALDRFRLPTMLVGLGILLGIVWPLVWPAFQVVSWNGGPALPMAEFARLHVAATLAVGALAGLVLGGSMVRRTPGNMRAGDAASTILSNLMVGLYLGWQAAVSIATISLALRLLFLLSPARRWPVVVSIALATLFHLLGWRWLQQLEYWPGSSRHWALSLAALLAIAIAALLLDGIEHGGDAGPPQLDPPPDK